MELIKQFSITFQVFDMVIFLISFFIVGVSGVTELMKASSQSKINVTWKALDIITKYILVIFLIIDIYVK